MINRMPDFAVITPERGESGGLFTSRLGRSIGSPRSDLAVDGVKIRFSVSGTISDISLRN